MRFSPSQLLALFGLGVCVLGAAAVCLFAPIRFAILAVLIVPVICTLAVLVFLRKTLANVYRLRDQVSSGITARVAVTEKAPAQRELDELVSRLDRIENHLPERIAARLAFEQALRASRAELPPEQR